MKRTIYKRIYAYLIYALIIALILTIIFGNGIPMWFIVLNFKIGAIDFTLPSIGVILIIGIFAFKDFVF